MLFVLVPYFTVIFPFQFCFSFCKFVRFSFSLFYVTVCVSVKPLTLIPVVVVNELCIYYHWMLK